jgi:hypothetical protein
MTLSSATQMPRALRALIASLVTMMTKTLCNSAAAQRTQTVLPNVPTTVTQCSTAVAIRTLAPTSTSTCRLVPMHSTLPGVTANSVLIPARMWSVTDSCQRSASAASAKQAMSTSSLNAPLVASLRCVMHCCSMPHCSTGASSQRSATQSSTKITWRSTIAM